MSEENDKKQRQALPYQVAFAKEIEREYAEIAQMRDEEGKELPNKRVKKLQQGVQVKYKKLFAEQNKVAVEKKAREFVPQVEDKSLPKAVRISLRQADIDAHVDQRVELHAWCHRVRI